MRVKLITVCTDPNDLGLQQLNKSLDKFNWDYEILVAPEWKGFGTKILTVYEYLKNSDIDAIFFCDAYDCVVLNEMGLAISRISVHYGLDKIVFSGERGCWPMVEWEKYYSEIHDHGYNYLNSGLYYAPKKQFIELIESKMPEFHDDDQKYMTEHLLFNENSNIVLDNNCTVFQSYSFISEDDYTYYPYRGRLFNNKTETSPLLIHGNGRTDLTKIYELL